MHDNEGKPYLMLRTAVEILSTKSDAAPAHGSGETLPSSTGSVLSELKRRYQEAHKQWWDANDEEECDSRYDEMMSIVAEYEAEAGAQKAQNDKVSGGCESE